MPSSTSEPAALHVTVRLFSVLRHRDGRIVDQLELELPSGSRARDVLDVLRVADELKVIVAVNGQIADEHTRLADGDCLAVIPAIAGG